MFRNYIKTAFRNLLRSKAISTINILGLAIGLASSFIILLFALHEFSYDLYNKNLDDIYLVTSYVKGFNAERTNTPFLLGPTLKDRYPEVNKYARRVHAFTTIKYKDIVLVRGLCYYTDPDIFNILTLPIEKGSTKELFEDKNSVILSQENAQKFFGKTNPIGKILSLRNAGGTYEVKVAGIMKDIPSTSTFKAGIILPISLAEKALINQYKGSSKNVLESRTWLTVNTYLLLNNGSNSAELENKLARYSEEYSMHEWLKLRFDLLPVKDIYFRTAGLLNNFFPTGNITNLYIYSVIGILILLIACLNIIVLNTGRASTRAKEIGVRKVMGAGRPDLIRQILMESMLVTLLSLPLAVLLVELFLPSISILLGKGITLDYFNNLRFIFAFAGLAILVGILSGSYISFYLSKLRPIDIMRNKITIGTGKTTFRKIMISVQMIIFIGLIIAFISVNKQMKYFHEKDLGYNVNNLIVLDGIRSSEELDKNFETLKNELKADPNIISVSGALEVPPTEDRAVSLIPNDSDHSKKIRVEEMSVDKDFIETMGMKIIKGRSFADIPAGELKNVCIINEAAVKQLSIKNPLEKVFGQTRVIGVLKDFNMHSLREPIGPVLINASTKYLREIVVRVRPANISQTLSFIQSVSKKFNHDKAMNYEFFGDRIDGLYKQEARFDDMMGYFTGLAIFIACLGLFGMSLFAGQQRLKEMGIRKIIGASTENIFYILTKEFIILTIFSTIIAVPISAYFIDKWLQNFVYRIKLDPYIFILSALSALVIAVLSVGYQAIKIAVSNPVESLRNE